MPELKDMHCFIGRRRICQNQRDFAFAIYSWDDGTIFLVGLRLPRLRYLFPLFLHVNFWISFVLLDAVIVPNICRMISLRAVKDARPCDYFDAERFCIFVYSNISKHKRKKKPFKERSKMTWR